MFLKNPVQMPLTIHLLLNLNWIFEEDLNEKGMCIEIEPHKMNGSEWFLIQCFEHMPACNIQYLQQNYSMDKPKSLILYRRSKNPYIEREKPGKVIGEKYLFPTLH